MSDQANLTENEVLNRVYDPATQSFKTTAAGAGYATEATLNAVNTAIGTKDDASLDADANGGTLLSRVRGIAKAIFAVIAGTSKVAVKNSDGTNISYVSTLVVTGSANGVGQFEVNAIDVSQYKSLSLQRTGTFAVSVAFECSNDNVNWTPCPLNIVSTVPGGVNTTVASSANAMYIGNINYKWFRSRITAYTSGTVNTTLLLTPLAVTLPTQAGSVIQSGTWNVGSSSDYPAGAVAQTAASGNVSNASAAATLATAVGKTTYITGFTVTAAGATAGSVVSVTVTGVITGTLTYTFAVPTGATLAAQPLTVNFSKPIPASATNTTIVVTCPALGAGNTNASVVAQGYQL